MKYDDIDLGANWFNFCFDNPEKIKPIHTAMYFFLLDYCGRTGGKRIFDIPICLAMESIGEKSMNRIRRTLDDLKSFGFITYIRELNRNSYRIVLNK